MSSERFDFLLGRTVEEIRVWADTVRLVIDRGEGPAPAMYVEVHSDSELSDGATRARLDVRTEPDDAGAILRLLNRRIINAEAVDGVLRLAFEKGAVLTSPADEQYETWTVVGDGRVFQCMPGGEVDSW